MCAPNFAGGRCEVAMRGPGPKLMPPLPAGLCRPPSRLVALIAGGFRCENCSLAPQQTPLCQLRARRFGGIAGGHLALPPLAQRSHFALRLAFATAAAGAANDALLLSAGRYSGAHDRLLLRLSRGRLVASLSFGSARADLELALDAGCARCRFDDGAWHTVGLALANRTLTLSRGDAALLSIASGAALCGGGDSVATGALCEPFGGVPALPGHGDAALRRWAAERSGRRDGGGGVRGLHRRCAH